MTTRVDTSGRPTTNGNVQEIFYMLRLMLVLVLGLSFGSVAFAEDAMDNAANEKADNSGRNKRERNDNEKDPTDQKGNAADIAITQKIRRALTDDKNLSTYAHNVKIITQDGVVNLKGPVRNADEKKIVEDKATQVAGADKVKSQLEIAPKE